MTDQETRDMFAAHAMGALIAGGFQEGTWQPDMQDPAYIAVCAQNHADAMMDERAKRIAKDDG